MNEIIAELLKKVDVKQINELLGKLPKGADGKIGMSIVKKIAEKLGADPAKLAALLPGILKKTEGDLTAEKMLGAIDIKEIAKIIPAAGAIKIAHSVSSFAAKKIEAEMDKIKEVESTLWKGSTTKEIQKAADMATEYTKTEIGETVTEDDVTLLKAYRDLAQQALDNAKDRKEKLIKAGTDKYSDPVAEMNTAIVKCSGALRKLTEMVEEAEKKLSK